MQRAKENIEKKYAAINSSIKTENTNREKKGETLCKPLVTKRKHSAL